MLKRLARMDMLADDLEHHISTEIRDASAAEIGEILANCPGELFA